MRSTIYEFLMYDLQQFLSTSRRRLAGEAEFIRRLVFRAQGAELTNSHIGIRPSYFLKLSFINEKR